MWGARDMLNLSIKGNVSDRARSEIEAYIGILEQQKEVLESKFINAEIIGDKNTMYDTFVNLINYNMIDSGDYRLCEKNSYKTNEAGEKIKVKTKYKGFDGNTSRSRPLYNPKTESYIGMWMFGRLAHKTGMITKTYQHWGVRAEKGYECPIVFSENLWPIEITLIDSVPKAESCARELSSLLESNGKKLSNTDKSDLLNMLRIGMQRIYTIRCEKWANYDKELGYIRLFYDFNNNTVNAVAHLNWKIIIRKFIDIKNFVKELKNVMSETFASYNTLIDQSWAEQALEKQEEVITKNNLFAEKHNGLGIIQRI